MTNPFLPNKAQWDHATAQLDAIRFLLGLPAGADVVPTVQYYHETRELAKETLTNMANHREKIYAALGLPLHEDAVAALAEIRATFAHIIGPENETLPQLCARIADQHRRQAETIESLTRQRDKLHLIWELVSYEFDHNEVPSSSILWTIEAEARSVIELLPPTQPTHEQSHV